MVFIYRPNVRCDRPNKGHIDRENTLPSLAGQRSAVRRGQRASRNELKPTPGMEGVAGSLLLLEIFFHFSLRKGTWTQELASEDCPSLFFWKSVLFFGLVFEQRR